MKEEEFIKRRGIVAYRRMLRRGRVWHVRNHKEHPEEKNAKNREWRAANPDKVKANSQEANRKGGKYYEHKKLYQTTGLQGERNKIRGIHSHRYRPFKQIIASDSRIHHEWIPGTAKYTGVALVESVPHSYGIIDVIQVLEGEITLFSEKEIRVQGGG